MSLNGALQIAASGLRAAQSGLDVVSRNVANSQVAGYTRKQTPLESLVVGDEGAGVRTLDVIRQVNDTLLTQLQGSNSANQRLSVEDDLLSRFETAFGSPGDSANIAAKLGNLHNSFAALTVSPDDATAQSQAIAQAQAVVDNFHQMASNIRALREEADGHIADSVGTINAAL